MKAQYFISSLFFFLLVCTVPSSANAESVMRIGAGVSVSPDQVVEGNYYTATRPWEQQVMSGDIEGDMYSFGGTVTIDGTVAEDLFITAGVARVHATVTDDVRILGGEVTLTDHVGGDVLVVGGSLHMLPSASVEGTVFFFGGQADLQGSITGSVVGKADRITINANVQEDVDVTTATRLQVGPDAEVDGTFRYQSPLAVSRHPDSVIAGEVIRNTGQDITYKEQAQEVVGPLFILLFSVLTMYLLFRRQLTQIVIVVQNQPAKTAVFGLLVVLAAPVLAGFLFVTSLGLMLGLILLLVAALVSLLAIIAAGPLLGAYIEKVYRKELRITLPGVILGTTVLYMMIFIPVIGASIWLAAVLFTAGAILVQITRHLL